MIYLLWCIYKKEPLDMGVGMLGAVIDVAVFGPIIYLIIR